MSALESHALSDAPRAAPLAPLYLVRHGETAWSLTGQHTGRLDLPLTPLGECNARALAERLATVRFKCVLTSPLRRVRRTCELAGFAASAVIDADLTEWDYGAYQGKTLAQIRAERPGWDIFRDGCPQGESPAQVAERADRVIARVRAVPGEVLIFSSGHLLRVLAARWLGFDATLARHLLFDTTAISVLAHERGATAPAIRLWNDQRHLQAA
ncbi:MAG TPA: histidine phosphatase family protein [Steroidobacteraceae bacterium]|nr:histidine phosphatase family protein [Steroidobacteraceae bacterium]